MLREELHIHDYRDIFWPRAYNNELITMNNEALRTGPRIVQQPTHSWSQAISPPEEGTCSWDSVRSMDLFFHRH